MQKGFAPILIVLGIVVIIAIAGGAYLFGRSASKPVQPETPQVVVTLQPTSSPQPSPSPDETANWKILTNKNDFSIKYPSSLKALGVGIQVDETDASDVIIASKPGDPEDTMPALHINVTPKAITVFKDMTLAQISQANYEANQINKSTFKEVTGSLKLITLSNKPAYTYTIQSSRFSGKWSGWPVNASINNTEKLTVIESENNGNYFIIVYSSDDPTLATVLSTFKLNQ